MNQIELFTLVFGHCRYHHWKQAFFSTKVLYCNDQLNPQPHGLVEIGFSHCHILYRSEIFVVIFLWRLWVLHLSSWNLSWTKVIVQICLDICQSPQNLVQGSSIVKRDIRLVVGRSDMFLWLKVKEWFWSYISLLLEAAFLVIVNWPFHLRRFFLFLVIVTWHIHIWNLFPFLIGLYKT